MGCTKLRNEFSLAVKSTLPIIFGYFPVGLAFGVMASQTGLNLFDIFFMSLFVYAGSSQLIALGLIEAGASIPSIIFTTLLVNLRHLLMSASLAPYVKKIKRHLLPLIAYGITDETFAITITEVEKKRRSAVYFFTVNIVAQTTWVFSSLLGGIMVGFLPNTEKVGINFALPAMFIALMMLQIRNKICILVAVISGVLSLIISLLIQGNWNIIIATISAATIGVMIESWNKKFS